MSDYKLTVSVITAAYNCSSTIGETIESVLVQTWVNWEMIIVDDCSTDNTVEVVNEYIKKDSRIKLIQLEKNSGAAVARNRAIKASVGKYIALLDSDDLWKPNKLERQIDFMKSRDLSMSFTAYDVFKDSSERIRKVFTVPQKINYKQYLRNTSIGCLTVIIDKDKIPDFHMEEGYLEDVLTWMYYLRNGVVAYGLNENLASYRVNINSKSGKKIKNAKRYYQCLEVQPDLELAEKLISQCGYMFNAVRKRVFAKRIVV